MKQDQEMSAEVEEITPAEIEGRLDLRKATHAHVIPFAFWIAWIYIWGQLDIRNAWTYAAQTAIALGLLLYYRPWRWCAAPSWKYVPLALFVGIAVFLIWIAPETEWVAARWPAFHAFYAQYLIFPPWEIATTSDPSPYNPMVCGWTLSLIRLIGSAFVIAVIEEFFWRAWLYRWLLGRNFLKVDPGVFDRGMFLAASFVFALEHAQLVVGFIAGLAYLALYIRTRDIWASIIAHVTTNFLLGVYVLVAGAYQHW